MDSPDDAAPSAMPAPPRADARVGDVIAGKWRLERVLGAGGMATVFAATHTNGSRVAIKVLRPSVARDAELVARFKKEGRIGNLVDHPGAIRVLDEGETDEGLAYLVMELLEGESLDRRIAHGGPLAPLDAARVIDAVLDVLDAAHARGLVHRDIKPENVFLTRAGGIKLLDFGIAREHTAGKGETVAGLVLGTPAFMPPEQARGRWEEVDARSDLWAVGATLFVALTDRLLRDGATPAEELLAAMQPVPPVRALAPHVPPPLAAVLDHALAFDRAARFASAGEMRAALHAATFAEARRTTPTPVSLPAMSAGPTPRAPWRALAVALAGAAALAALAGAFAARSAPAPRASFLPEPPAPALGASPAEGASAPPRVSARDLPVEPPRAEPSRAAPSAPPAEHRAARAASAAASAPALSPSAALSAKRARDPLAPRDPMSSGRF